MKSSAAIPVDKTVVHYIILPKDITCYISDMLPTFYKQWFLGAPYVRSFFVSSGWSRYPPPTKIKSNQIFLWANIRRVAWKIFENHDKIFENRDAVEKQRKYGSPSIILSILQFKFNVMKFTLNFRAAISYQSLFSVAVFKISPWLYASNITVCIRIYYCATSLRNHRLFLIPHFELWNLPLTLASWTRCSLSSG